MPILLSINTLTIDILKITRYLLDSTHVQGRSKAKYFLGHGFSRSDPNTFARALFEHGRNSPLETQAINQFGTTLVFRGKLQTPKGVTRGDVRTIWNIAAGTDVGRLVTAYPC